MADPSNRERVLEVLTKSKKHRPAVAIARELQIPVASVSTALQWLKHQGLAECKDGYFWIAKKDG